MPKQRRVVSQQVRRWHVRLVKHNVDGGLLAWHCHWSLARNAVCVQRRLEKLGRRDNATVVETAEYNG